MTAREKIEAVVTEVEEDTNFEIVSEMKAALNAIYGDDRNQISKPTSDSVIKMAAERGHAMFSTAIDQMEATSRIKSYIQSILPDALSYQIIIHFPEFNITNNVNTHLIKNMYVRLFLRPSGLLASHMEGVRTTVTEAEYMSQYLHSHLPRMDSRWITFHHFCTGVGEINQVLALLNTSFTSANFMMLLMHIKNYLEWESKEGHPYMFMENVFSRSTQYSVHNSLPDHLAAIAADKLLLYMKRVLNTSEIMDMFQFQVAEREIVATSTLKLEKWMADIIEGWDIRAMVGSSHENSVFLSLRDNAGNYHALPQNSRRISHDTRVILNFKGRDIKFEVTERSQTQKNETFANPKITKEACEKLSRDITKAALSSAGIKSGSSLIYNSRPTEADQVPVQGDMDGRMVGDALL